MESRGSESGPPLASPGRDTRTNERARSRPFIPSECESSFTQETSVGPGMPGAVGGVTAPLKVHRDSLEPKFSGLKILQCYI